MSYLPILERYEGKAVGRDYNMPCPWHSETRPSLYVMIEPPGSWHCFSCERSGPIVSLIVQIEKISYDDAYELIALRTGINGHQFKRKSDQTIWEPIPESEFDVFEPVKSPRMLAYLKSRKISPAAAKHFDLREGNPLDYKWRKRIIYTIRNAAGNIVSMEGRTIVDAPLRYFKAGGSKSSQGFLGFLGLKKGGPVLIVEGAFDALSVVQVGFKRVLPMCGSDLSDAQLGMLRTITKEPVVILDGPRAGTEEQRAEVVKRIKDTVLPFFPKGRVTQIKNPDTDPNDLLKSGKLKTFVQKVLAK